jgi:hypothetical protein
MSDKEEHELRCGESFPRSAPKPRCSTATSARCSFPLVIRVLVCGSAASCPFQCPFIVPLLCRDPTPKRALRMPKAVSNTGHQR